MIFLFTTTGRRGSRPGPGPQYIYHFCRAPGRLRNNDIYNIITSNLLLYKMVEDGRRWPVAFDSCRTQVLMFISDMDVGFAAGWTARIGLVCNARFYCL